MSRTKFGVLAIAIAMGGCAAGGSNPSTSALTIEEIEQGVRGTFIDGSERQLGQIDFTSRYVDSSILEIQLELHGLTVTALVDFERGVAEYDGFTTATGEDTQIVDQDRALFSALSRELDHLGAEVDDSVRHLRSFVNTWAEFPNTLDPQGIALLDTHRSASLCHMVNNYVRSTHDCWEEHGDCDDCEWYDPVCGCEYWNDNSTLDYTYLSMHGAGPCADGTYFWNGSSWVCYEPNHPSNIEYGYGLCFGRCGEGCGSSTQFTQACANHDQCVRWGHSTISAWCDDDFVDAAWDWTWASNC